MDWRGPPAQVLDLRIFLHSKFLNWNAAKLRAQVPNCNWYVEVLIPSHNWTTNGNCSRWMLHLRAVFRWCRLGHGGQQAGRCFTESMLDFVRIYSPMSSRSWFYRRFSSLQCRPFGSSPALTQKICSSPESTCVLLTKPVSERAPCQLLVTLPTTCANHRIHVFQFLTFSRFWLCACQLWRLRMIGSSVVWLFSRNSMTSIWSVRCERHRFSKMSTSNSSQ